MLSKQQQFVDRMEEKLFDTVATLSVSGFETYDKLDFPPKDAPYRAMAPGDTWGDNKKYAWFHTTYTVPAELERQDLYLLPQYNGYEALLFVDGVPYTNFASKIVVNTHGNHYCKVFLHNARAGQRVSLDLEAYAGHHASGCIPYEEPWPLNFPYTLGEFRVCVRNALFSQFYYDYKTLREMYDVLGYQDFKKAQIEQCFIRMHDILFYADKEVDRKTLRDSVSQAIELMRPLLSAKRKEHCRGEVGIIGHSHMDTAWLWEMSETVKKCARTFSNQLSLMERYEEYHFVQSSSYHLRMMEQHYPRLFERIAEKVKEGRYEPNGGSWIECDCNITGGEFLIRQFLWGQNYTKKHFGYLSNAFYLPDTFGYSAAIPQILKGVGIRYFLTTKLTWNDTNQFPYETYYWEGIDGSRVFAHHNLIHCWPSPKTVIPALNSLQQKSVSDKRLVTFGFGDGGGGPEDGMLEMAKRIEDLEGCPRVYHTTVGAFMENLEATAYQPNVYRGELYLELHRGTLTNQHEIKRNNRKAEIAIHDAEYLTVVKALAEGTVADEAIIAPYVETLLVNQFHDILPGTCISEANECSVRETTELIEKVRELTQTLLADDTQNTVTLTNTLSAARHDVIRIRTAGYLAADCHQQRVAMPDGTEELHVSGLHLDAFSSQTFALAERCSTAASPFSYQDGTLQTPYATVRFDENGSIASFFDRLAGRELRGDGFPLNTLLFGEDMPLNCDCWDIDADTESKLRPCTALEAFDVVADGAVEFRIRCRYRLSEKSVLHQDMVFYADSPRVDFETCVDWHDPHRLLKACFDVAVRSDYVTQEIQYGNLKRTTKRNTSTEQAAFEVCNQKYTDLSEPGYGVAILNDCKYGITAQDSRLALTLHCGGTRPDRRGDAGVHHFTYAFFHHVGGFRAENTVWQGYFLNYPVIVSAGAKKLPQLLSIDQPNIVVEAVKPCEEADRAFIVRLYEAEGTYTNAVITPLAAVKKIMQCDMLENEQESVGNRLSFRPFEIKTLKLSY